MEKYYKEQMTIKRKAFELAFVQAKLKAATASASEFIEMGKAIEMLNDEADYATKKYNEEVKKRVRNSGTEDEHPFE